MLGHLDPIFDRTVTGWAVDPDQSGSPCQVTLLVDEVVQCAIAAQGYRADLLRYGDGKHSFHWRIPDHLADGAQHSLVARFSDGTELIGSPQRFELLKADEIEAFSVPEELHKRHPYHVTIGASVRDEAPYMLEWLAYHRVLGVDRFVIYDNESSDGTSELLATLARQGLLSHCPYPDSLAGAAPIQPAAYQDLVAKFGESTDWLIFLDPDEFIVPRKDDSVPALLQRFADAPALSVYWRLFGSSGLLNQGDALVMERFLRCSEQAATVNLLVKTFFRPCYLQATRVHLPFLKEGRVLDEQRRVLDPHQGGCGLHPSHQLAAINHYFTKSREEWARKRARGRVDLPFTEQREIRSESDFALHDCNETEDRRILDFLQATKAEMRELEKLIGAS